MRKKPQKLFVLIAGLVSITLAGGCKEQNLSNTKRVRLIAAEKVQLKQDLAQCHKEIEEQKKLFAKFEQEEKDSEGRLEDALIDMSTTNFQDAEKIKKLEEENNKLKALIEGPKEQIQELTPQTKDQNSVK